MFFDMQPDTQKSSKVLQNQSVKLPRCPKMSILVAIWRLLGRHLGPSCRQVGLLGAPLGDLGRHLGHKMLPKQLPEPLLAILGAILTPKCSLNCSQSFSWSSFLKQNHRAKITNQRLPNGKGAPREVVIDALRSL